MSATSAEQGSSHEQADFAADHDIRECQVKVGSRGPVVDCTATRSGWADGIRGCPNAGGICTGCTVPGFHGRVMPFMAESSGAMPPSASLRAYGSFIRTMRAMRRTHAPMFGNRS